MYSTSRPAASMSCGPGAASPGPWLHIGSAILFAIGSVSVDTMTGQVAFYDIIAPREPRYRPRVVATLLNRRWLSGLPIHQSSVLDPRACGSSGHTTRI